ncbi:hypothetical protein DRN73_05125, partial [Candidatus Pacearchaeota archaeon]
MFKFLNKIENRGYSFKKILYFVILMSVFRYFFENAVEKASFYFPKKFYLSFLECMFHFPLWFSFAFLISVLLIKFFSKEEFHKVLNVCAFFWFFIFLTPLFDLLILGGKANIKYIFNFSSAGRVLTSLFNFKEVTMGVTPGIKVEMFIVLLAVLIYIFLKTSNIILSLSGAFLTVLAIFLIGSYPALLSLISGKSYGEFFSNFTGGMLRYELQKIILVLWVSLFILLILIKKVRHFPSIWKCGYYIGSFILGFLTSAKVVSFYGLFKNPFDFLLLFSFPFLVFAIENYYNDKEFKYFWIWMSFAWGFSLNKTCGFILVLLFSVDFILKFYKIDRFRPVFWSILFYFIGLASVLRYRFMLYIPFTFFFLFLVVSFLFVFLKKENFLSISLLFLLLGLIFTRKEEVISWEVEQDIAYNKKLVRKEVIEKIDCFDFDLKRKILECLLIKGQ